MSHSSESCFLDHIIYLFMFYTANEATFIMLYNQNIYRYITLELIIFR